ncbi:Outer membrane receptor proteins, mostly Fe transport [Saccharicrinis carchari]|uniref:Outer membrane receptor proteins, mostly Fe transport n=1 Tax=Saccharicrinis carchari TaxID=1168039 RepID=A0A521CJ81_SACCC|nr:TonB-dependent receptor [Saccharicrinis carchari]SMO59506.1 Outer membrane receptor proteins, mostly Fe transport [Saccharicrinis carchari]
MNATKKKWGLICWALLMVFGPALANPTNEISEKGVLKGHVYDSKTGQAVEYATIAVYKSRDNSLVTGEISDADGAFAIKGLEAGEFYVTISFLGYDAVRYDKITVEPGRDVVNLGDIMLDGSSRSLDEVEVVADRQSIEFKIDKKVVSVGEQMTSASLSAVEVLENVPSIRVDIEGNVSLRGSTGFTVLIDGKPTVLDPSDALRQTPASTIENIEIITNPSAKYQPDGTGGIINIISKKNRMQGIQGLVNVKGGSFSQYGGDILLNWRQKNTNFYVGGDYNNRPFPGESFSERRTVNNGITTTKISEGENERSFNGGSFRAGFDWDITEKDFFSIGIRTGKYNMDSESDLYYTTRQTPGNTILSEFNRSDAYRGGSYYSLTGNYQRKFAQEGHELSAQLNYRSREGEEWSENRLYSENKNQINSGTRTTEDGPSARWEMRLDYTKPIGEKDRFEAGFQGRSSESDDITTLSVYDQTIGEMLLQEDKSNEINYSRNIYALYSTYNGQLGDFGYQLGLRGEYTLRDILNIAGDEKYTLDRWDYFPTLHLSYQLPKDHQLMASYSRRIDRPRGYYLEPFITWQDMYNVRQGNPNMDPEYIDAMELGYLKKWELAQLSLEGYYRVTHNKVERIQSVYEEGILLTAFANVGTDYSFGLDATYSVPLFKWWEVNLMGNMYDYRVEGSLNEKSFERSSFNWSSRLNSTFRVMKTVQLQLDGNYNSPTVTSQGETEGYYTMNGALRMDFLDRKLSAVVQVRDIFATARRVSETQDADFYNYQKWERKAPLVSFTLSYRINNFMPKRNNRGNGEDMGDEEF